MIKILYVIWSLGLGGAEQVVINLAKGLDKKRFMPFICCLNDEGGFAESVKDSGIKVFALNKIKGIDFSVIPRLVRIIRENNIQIVHTHLWGANFWGRFAAKTAGVPVVIATEHGIQEYRSGLHFFIDRVLSKYTNKIIFVSRTVRENYWKRVSTAYNKTAVIYNGIDILFYRSQDVNSSLKSEFGIKDGEKVLAIVGRLSPEKGHGFLINAFKILLDHRPSTIDHRLKLLIVGDGPLLESLKLKAKSEKLEDKVVFTGVRKDIPEILSITDILVLPSTREGLPVVLLEAMVAGAVVVAARVGGTPELVEDGISGFLVEPKDTSALREKLEYVLCNLDNLEGVKEKARRTVEERFSIEKMVSEYQKIYVEQV